MNRKSQTKTVDREVQSILDVLQSYKVDHPKAKIDAYRQYAYSIRVRIVDPGFAKMDWVGRHNLASAYLDPLSDELLSQVSLLVLVTPREMKSSGANIEFEDPIVYPEELNGEMPKTRK